MRYLRSAMVSCRGPWLASVHFVTWWDILSHVVLMIGRDKLLLYLLGPSSRPLGPIGSLCEMLFLFCNWLHHAAIHVTALERMETFLVGLCCCNEIPVPGQLIKNRNVFLTLLKAGKAKVRALAGSVSGEGPMFLLPGWHLVVVSSWQKGWNSNNVTNTESSHGRRTEAPL